MIVERKKSFLLLLALSWLFFHQPVQAREGELIVRFLQGNDLVSLELEDYVGGVVLAEVGHGWPEEALKAMAVCARTFGLRKVIENYAEQYHLTNSTADQVYRRGYLEHPTLRRAVEETRGQVLAYMNAPARVFYHASSGGRTSCSSSVWGGDKISYLRGVVDPYSLDNPYSEWELEMDAGEFLARLGLPAGDSLLTLEVVERSDCRRATVVELRMTGDRVVRTCARQLRERHLGTENLRSTFFEVVLEGGKVLFKGRGWGHGVGLSQWGARKMAEEGFSYRDILLYYFPGTEIRRFRI